MKNKELSLNLERWSDFLSTIRRFFHQNNVLEVQTPTLVVSPGSEPYLDFFETQAQWGQNKKTFYLPTSPEWSLKKLLPKIDRSIFEIRTCFRNNEFSPLHRVEFFLLEWYLIHSNFNDLILFTHNFFINIATELKNNPRFNKQALESLSNTWGKTPTIETIQNLFQSRLNFTLSPETNQKELYELSVGLGLRAESHWTFDELFHYLMIEKIEPTLDPRKLTFVTHYPPSQAALAQIDSSGWALRFEVYAEGTELANAYFEVTSLEEQKKRFASDNQRRKELGKPESPIDNEFFQAFEEGIPSCAGIALGLERFFMILNKKETIHFWSPLWKMDSP